MVTEVSCIVSVGSADGEVGRNRRRGGREKGTE